jgi:hypothetical protein
MGKNHRPIMDQQSVGKRSLHHLLACQLFLTESHIVTHLGNKRASFFNMNDINDNSYFGTSEIDDFCKFHKANIICKRPTLDEALRHLDSFLL